MTRDVHRMSAANAARMGARGDRAALEGYEAFSRGPCEHRIVYLFVDGIAERLRAGRPREVALIGEDRKVLLHLNAGPKQDTRNSTRLLSVHARPRARRSGACGLRRRTRGDPGDRGSLPALRRQRCLAHSMRNLAAKVPTDLWPEFKARATACYQVPSRAIARDLGAAWSPSAHGFGEKAVLKLIFGALNPPPSAGAACDC